MRWRIKIRQVSSPKASFKGKRGKKTAQNGDREIPWGNSSIILLSTMSATHGLCLVSSHLILSLNTQSYIKGLVVRSKKLMNRKVRKMSIFGFQKYTYLFGSK